MYKLNFPNGNVQEYKSSLELQNAAKLMGGEARYINSNTYIFVPKK